MLFSKKLLCSLSLLSVGLALCADPALATESKGVSVCGKIQGHVGISGNRIGFTLQEGSRAVTADVWIENSAEANKALQFATAALAHEFKLCVFGKLSEDKTYLEVRDFVGMSIKK
jgi:hypothetical protein